MRWWGAEGQAVDSSAGLNLCTHFPSIQLECGRPPSICGLQVSVQDNLLLTGLPLAWTQPPWPQDQSLILSSLEIATRCCNICFWGPLECNFIYSNYAWESGYSLRRAVSSGGSGARRPRRILHGFLACWWLHVNSLSSGCPPVRGTWALQQDLRCGRCYIYIGHCQRQEMSSKAQKRDHFPPKWLPGSWSRTLIPRREAEWCLLHWGGLTAPSVGTEEDLACLSFPAQAGAYSVAQQQGSHRRARTARREARAWRAFLPPVLPLPFPTGAIQVGWGATGRTREPSQPDGSWAIQQHGQASAPQGPRAGAPQWGLYSKVCV